MVEAYASLVSLMHIIDQIVDHGRNSFEVNHEQIQSLYEKAAFLVDFLESYSNGDNKEVEDLESRIADASHEAEDLIESKVVDYILNNKNSNIFTQKLRKLIRVIGTIPKSFHQQLQEVIESMDLMKEVAMEIKEKGEVKDRLPKDSGPSTSSTFIHAGRDIMVGFDDVLIQIMDRLTGLQSNRLVIPVSGMGGIGKTTLTRNAYENPCIVQHFDIQAWVTISQDCEIREILSSLLTEFRILTKETTQVMNEGQLGEYIHKHLFGRRYLIVMDDIWSIDVWEKFQLFFPDNGNGSRIVITTRISNMTRHLGSCDLEISFLDEEKSWDLFHTKVFGRQKCPPALVNIGRSITKSCRGLPLSIVVIAGLLVNSHVTLEYWNHVANEVNSILSQAGDGHCSQILSLSYKNLPVHLKPCLLYMGVYPEDHEIKVSELVKLWVAEGFLKPNKTKTLEEVANEYLMDLINRNLVIVHKQGLIGNVKICKVHDRLRDLCLREAQRINFISVKGRRGPYNLPALGYLRRIVIVEKEQKVSVYTKNQGGTESKFLPRSVIFNTRANLSLHGCRLMRVLLGKQLHKISSNQVNLRYLDYSPRFISYPSKIEFPSSINLLWNLQTIILRGGGEECKAPNIWEMKQLRHFCVTHAYLSEPPPLNAAVDGGREETVLKHLKTLQSMRNLALSQSVIKRIPNITKLVLFYENFIWNWERREDYFLSNLQYLQKLESLQVNICSMGKLYLPYSLKKLNLHGSCISWENMTIIGCLPNLEVLKLRSNSFIGDEWNPIEGQFISLKCLQIYYCNQLKLWNAESIHFPVLEKLHLKHMSKLEEIPQGIGEIPTLKSIEIYNCSDSTVRSAMDILDEQESQGNLDIKLRVGLFKDKTQLKNLETRDNFIVGYCWSGL